MDRQVHLHNTFKVGYKPGAPYYYRERDLPSQQTKSFERWYINEVSNLPEETLNERGFEWFLVKDGFRIVSDCVYIYKLTDDFD